jgi:Leucine-rich repeat (LRR) protein
LEDDLKGCPFSLRVTSRSQPPTKIFLGFYSREDRDQWEAELSKGLQRSPTKVDLSSRSLESLPEFIFQVPQITSLDLRKNNFSDFNDSSEEDTSTPNASLVAGPLDELSKFQSLVHLNLSSNNLKKFPAAVLSLKTVEEIDLSYNVLSELPHEITKMINLKQLNLEANKLQEVCSSLGELSQLQYLNFSWNSLRELPRSMSKLSNLDTLV